MKKVQISGFDRPVGERISYKALLLAGLSLLVSGAILSRVASATTLQKLELRDLIQQSTAILRAKVVKSRAVARGASIYTLYELDVLEQLRPPKSTLAEAAIHEIAVPGGVAGGIRQLAEGAPVLRPGTEYVLFVWRGKSGLTQLMGLSQGLFLVERSATGGDAGLENAKVVQTAASDKMLDTGGRPVRPEAISMKLSELKARVAKASLEGALGGVPLAGAR